MSGAIPANSTYGTPWSTGLCDCFDDFELCCCVCWCPCIPFGQTSEIIDERSNACLVNGLVFILLRWFTPFVFLYTFTYRSRLRVKYQLQESPCDDCCVHCWCLECALCQEYRELKNRGFDMHIGWQGNAQRQNRGLEIPPVVEGQMQR